MNKKDGPRQITGYKKTITGMVLLLLVVLVVSNIFLLDFQRREYLKKYRDRMIYEVDEAAAFMVEPLLKHQYADVDLFIRQWAESHEDVISFEATTPKGFVLSSFQREKVSPYQLSVEKDIIYAGRQLLSLSMTKDYSEIEKVLAESRNFLLLTSLLIASLLGAALWFVFRGMAIKPLEKEIMARYRAEAELENINRHLDEQVRQRTRELSEKNKDLLSENRQRREAENQLASEKEQLAVTLRSIGDGVITTDINGRIVLVNKVAEALTGWTQREAAGRPLTEVFRIINERTRVPCENPVDKVLATGGIVGLANHTALLAKDGRELIIADSGAPIRDRDSRIVGVVLVFRDITNQDRIEKELTKVRKLEAVGILAGGIAHDFNNILAGIMGNISLALLKNGLPDKTRNLLTEAEKATSRATNLTRQLLTFAKGGEPVKETASLDNVIRDSANFVLHGENVASRFDIPEDLWLVDIDRGQISQVIQNIVLNAGQAMPEGGTVKISCANVPAAESRDLSLPIDGRSVKISIEDTGIGIPPKAIDKIFDPYYSTKHHGSGLGLSICHSIITQHGGHIEVASEPGVGTTFTIYLPASEKTRDLVVEPDVSAESRTGAKIMVMDDEEMVRKIAGKMLTHLGHEVETAVDGQEAIELYRQAREAGAGFDLVIMDLTIPGGMGGKEAVQKILAIDPEAKVVVSSGYSNDPILADYTTYGFCAAIGKPYKTDELGQLINQVLR